VSYLPVYLVTYFSNIPSVSATHSATLITIFPVTILLGLAAKSFIFSPAISIAPSKKTPFNPGTATLAETFFYNIWGHSKRTKIVIQRTVTLMLVSGINTFVQTFVTIEGVEARGALAYSAVFFVAAGISGAALGVVADV
jgi:hypothetical protein